MPYACRTWIPPIAVERNYRIGSHLWVCHPKQALLRPESGDIVASNIAKHPGRLLDPGSLKAYETPSESDQQQRRTILNWWHPMSRFWDMGYHQSRSNATTESDRTFWVCHPS